MGQSRALFQLFSSFQTNIITILTTNQCEKMSIQYMVLGFKPTTFRTWVSSHNHLTRAPALLEILNQLRVEINAVEVFLRPMFRNLLIKNVGVENTKKFNTQTRQSEVMLPMDIDNFLKLTWCKPRHMSLRQVWRWTLHRWRSGCCFLSRSSRLNINENRLKALAILSNLEPF